MGGRQTAPWGVGQLGARGHFGGAPNPISAQSALGGPHTNPPCKGSAHTNPPVKSHPPRTPAPPAATPRPAPTRAPRDTWTPAPRPTPTPTAPPGPLGAWRTAPRPRARTDGPATPPQKNRLAVRRRRGPVSPAPTRPPPQPQRRSHPQRPCSRTELRSALSFSPSPVPPTTPQHFFLVSISSRLSGAPSRLRQATQPSASNSATLACASSFVSKR